jgi:hypothetical protein
LQNEIVFCKQILEEDETVATANVSFWSHLFELIRNYNWTEVINSNIKLLIELKPYIRRLGRVELGCHLWAVSSSGAKKLDRDPEGLSRGNLAMAFIGKGASARGGVPPDI